MKKSYWILLSFLFFLPGCGQYSDIYYSCEGNWDIKKEFLGYKESEKKLEILPFTVKFIYLGNLIEKIRGLNFTNIYEFNGETWFVENLRISESEDVKNKIVVESKISRVVTNSDKNYKGYIKEENISKSTGKLLNYKIQEFDFNRITGVIKYSLKYEGEFFSSISSQFMGSCKRVDKPL